MKRQRGVIVNGVNSMNPPKLEGTGGDGSAAMATMGKKKAKREVDRVKEEDKKENRDLGLVGGAGNNVMGWTNWEGFWPIWDEQMSWGSFWLPIWDMDFMGESFNNLYSDVVWDDDIWNLRKEIPNPSQL